jgi:hypothetical protein
VPGFLAQSTCLKHSFGVDVTAVAVASAPAFKLWYNERLR